MYCAMIDAKHAIPYLYIYMKRKNIDIESISKCFHRCWRGAYHIHIYDYICTVTRKKIEK